MTYELYATYIFDEATSLMCIGIDEQDGFAVLAPFHADDEDCLPELHVEDGVMVFNMKDNYPTLKRMKYNARVTRIVVE
ncbi:hypothetical protein BK131_04390 [Paenibacillus amylolyticus]|uniref:Uncharacterized protein n=1 Tax=Paenibacillus amylolyticus TaxID=1451 RepID=A0A1R1C572_PAEAM|nr:hypothetical protein [Paenibacillus amylolyticus]OMF17209.1 hypothetical protein BK131_04390 [Paenibacillus amylolyticus]